MVDNGSEEDAASALLAALRNAPVLRMGRNAHWAGGNNAGMRCRSAASTATLFWNNDAVPLEGTMVEYTRMARTMQRSAIGAVGCALQYPDGRLQVWRWGGVNGPVRALIAAESESGYGSPPVDISALPLQEAGSIIWANGGAMGYGRDARGWRKLPRFAFRRSVDYVSGACLAVRNDVLQVRLRRADVCRRGWSR